MARDKAGFFARPTARSVATTVLHRVVVAQAYASRVLDAELRAAGLPDRDARLATEIVYGALRILPALDAELDRHLTRGRPDPFTFAALRAAAYQARCLSRVPDHAIVQETVTLVKQRRGDGLGKLANAVLRRVVENRPREPVGSDRLIVPEWVERMLEAGLGPERAQQFLRLEAAAPALGLRVPAQHDPALVLEKLRAALPEGDVQRSARVERALSVRAGGDPRRLPGYEEGLFSVQDLGAQLIASLVGAMPGERVLDACAGHGGKTLALLDAVGSTGDVTAVDVHQAKLDQLGRELVRLGIAETRVKREAVDLSVGHGGLPPGYDRVLVDAPCTGLGTLQRRPEILLRVQPSDPARLAILQLTILERAARLVRPGGTLVYAVCSGSRAECNGVVEKLEGKLPSLRRLARAPAGVDVSADEDSVFRLGPWLGASGEFPDVYQVVCWTVLDSHPSPV